MNGARILVRADASPELGAGHVMRCIALAQELRRRGAEVSFVAASMLPLPASRLDTEGFVLRPLARPSDLAGVARGQDVDWIVFDVGDRLPEDLAGAGDARTLVIDDTGRGFVTAPTLVLNQNLHASETSYQGVDGAAILRGARYLLFRDEFVIDRPLRRLADPGRRVLLALGGADPDRLLLRFTEALAADPTLVVEVVAPSAHPDIGALRAAATSRSGVELHEDVRDMRSVMERAGLAVTSGGTTVWELALLGVPALVGSVAAVEERLLGGLRRSGLFRVLGPLRDVSSGQLASAVAQALDDLDWRRRTAVAAQELVDGRGRIRVVDEMIARS